MLIMGHCLRRSRVHPACFRLVPAAPLANGLSVAELTPHYICTVIASLHAFISFGPLLVRHFHRIVEIALLCDGPSLLISVNVVHLDLAPGWVPARGRERVL